MSELRECPFCGGVAEIYNVRSDDYSVHCISDSDYTCGLSSPHNFATKEAAIKYWNTRPAEEELKNEVERLKDEGEYKRVRIMELLTEKIDMKKEQEELEKRVEEILYYIGKREEMILEVDDYAEDSNYNLVREIIGISREVKKILKGEGDE